MKTLWLVLLFGGMGLFGCGPKGGDSESSGDAGAPDNGSDPNNPDGPSGPDDLVIGKEESGIEIKASNLTIPNLYESVAANTPGSLALTTGSALTAIEIDCSDSYDKCVPDHGTEWQQACTMIADIKCRIFSASGPTAISSILESVDSRMNEFEEYSEDAYLPCADPEVTESFEYDEETFPAYELVSFDLVRSGLLDYDENEKEIDLETTYKLSCLSGHGDDDEDNDGNPDGWSGFGVETVGDDEIYSLMDASTNGGKVAKVTNGTLIDIFYSVGDNDLDHAERDHSYGGSTGLIHMRSDEDSNTIEMTFAGANLGPGCGVHFITKGDYLYAKANMNREDQCEASWSGSYNASIDDMEFCVDVSGENPEIQNDATNCTNAGLTADAFALDTLDHTVIEPYNAPKMLSTFPEGVNPFAGIYADENKGGSEEE